MVVIDIEHFGFADFDIRLLAFDRKQVGGRRTKFTIILISKNHIAVAILDKVIAVAV